MSMITWFFAAVFAAAQPPAVLNYATSCAVIDANSADGYVTNLSTNTYQVTGPVRFVFSSPNDMSRPAIVYTANGIIPAGQTVRIARVKLAFQARPEETCQFEIKDAVRKP